tara:strand:+ start:17625 stop:18179 length:555 start_codon:yes stop_codon:yes gene_type:complete
MTCATTLWKRAKELEAALGVDHPEALDSRASFRKAEREAKARRKAKDPEAYKKAEREANARRKAKDPEAYKKACRKANRKAKLRRYGMTEDDYDTIHDSQGGVCKICKRPETAKDKHNKGEVKRLAVDHCHEENHVRGLLCTNCNSALGKFKDDTAALQRAIDYLNSNHKPVEVLRGENKIGEL